MAGERSAQLNLSPSISCEGFLQVLGIDRYDPRYASAADIQKSGNAPIYRSFIALDDFLFGLDIIGAGRLGFIEALELEGRPECNG